MSDVGKKLRQKREELGYEYDYIFQKTKIRPGILKALEEDDFKYFSSEIYFKSFLKKYARFLNLDFEDLLRELDLSEIAERKSSHLPPSVTPSLLRFSDKLYLGFKFLVLLVIVVGSIYLLFAGINKISSKLVSYKKPHPPSVETVRISQEETSSPVAAPVLPLSEVKSPQTSSLTEPLTLTLSAIEDCWVQLRADGEKIYEGILKKGQKESWKANKEFELWVGAASRLKVYLNGKDLGSLGRGVIKGIKIDSRGLKLP